MNYVRRLIKEDRLINLKNYLEKYIPEIKVKFGSKNNFLHLVVENSKLGTEEIYLLTNFSCIRVKSSNVSKSAKVMDIRIENCFFTFMCETYNLYHEAYVQSLKSYETEDCVITPVTSKSL